MSEKTDLIRYKNTFREVIGAVWRGFEYAYDNPGSESVERVDTDTGQWRVVMVRYPERRGLERRSPPQ